MSFVIKNYETICPECGKCCDGGYCYECEITLEPPIEDEEIAIDENVDMWEDFINNGDY